MSDWKELLSRVYKENSKKDPNYSLGQAMKDASIIRKNANRGKPVEATPNPASTDSEKIVRKSHGKSRRFRKSSRKGRKGKDQKVQKW